MSVNTSDLNSYFEVDESTGEQGEERTRHISGHVHCSCSGKIIPGIHAFVFIPHLLGPLQRGGNAVCTQNLLFRLSFSDRESLMITVSTNQEEGEHPEQDVAPRHQHDPLRVVHRVQVIVVKQCLKGLNSGGKAKREQENKR